MASRGGGEDFEPLPSAIRGRSGARLFQSDDRPTQVLLGADASGKKLNRHGLGGQLGRFGFIHLATHGVIDEEVPSAQQ